MTKLTEFEKQKAITCVGYIEGKFRCDRYKLEIEYDKLGHYDEELDRIAVTVMKINGVPTLLNLLDVDVSKNLNGDWEYNCTIEAIKNLVAPSKIYKK